MDRREESVVGRNQGRTDKEYIRTTRLSPIIRTMLDETAVPRRKTAELLFVEFRKLFF